MRISAAKMGHPIVIDIHSKRLHQKLMGDIKCQKILAEEDEVAILSRNQEAIMALAFLLAITFSGPQSAPSADDWRHAYQQTMLATIEKARLPAAIAVPQLAELYVSLETAESLPRVERTRMRRSLEGRLVKQLEQLVRDQRKRDSGRGRRMDQQLAGGAAVGAQQLIELIVNTIAPDSWRQNGGQGSISFYPYNPALVIRQTSETHEQVGELLRALAH